MSASTELARRYDRLAPRWGSIVAKLGFARAYQMFLREALARWPTATQARTMLDVGCGDGALALAVSQVLGPAVDLTLLDTSAAMLRAAGGRLASAGVPCALWHESSADAAQVAGSHDIVAAAHVIEHLDDLSQTMRDLAGLVKPGGVLLLVVSQPHWCSGIVWLRWRHRVYRAETVLAAMAAAGLAGAQSWRFAEGPPSRLSLCYGARKPKQPA